MAEPVTGTLADFGLNSMLTDAATITFTPSGPTIRGMFLLATRPITVTPDVLGAFTVQLATTAEMIPPRWFTITIKWLDSGGQYVNVDFPDWRLFVPFGGGAITDLLQLPPNPQMIWTSESEPLYPSVDMWWLKPSTGEIKEWS